MAVQIPPWLAGPTDPASKMIAGLHAGIQIGSEQSQQVNAARLANLRAQEMSNQMQEAQARLEQAKAATEMEHQAKMEVLKNSVLHQQQVLAVDKAYKQNLADYRAGQLETAKQKVAVDAASHEALNRYRSARIGQFDERLAMDEGSRKALNDYRTQRLGQFGDRLAMDKERAEKLAAPPKVIDVDGVKFAQHANGTLTRIHADRAVTGGKISAVDTADLRDLENSKKLLWNLEGEAKDRALAEIESKRQNILAKYRPSAPAAGSNAPAPAGSGGVYFDRDPVTGKLVMRKAAPGGTSSGEEDVDEEDEDEDAEE